MPASVAEWPVRTVYAGLSRGHTVGVSQARAPTERPLAPWLSIAVLGALGLGAAAVVVARAPNKVLAVEFAVGILAANVAFSRVGDLPPRRRAMSVALLMLANFGGVIGGCFALGPEASAWLLAIPGALLAPRRGLGGDRRTLVYVVALAAVTALGCALNGADPWQTASVALAILAAGSAPLLSYGALELRDELSSSQSAIDELRVAREAAEAGALRLRAQLRDENRQVRTEAELTARFEQRFAAVEARHDQILAAIVDAVLTVDARGVITSANPACEAIFRAERAQIIGWPLTRFLPKATPRMLQVIHSSAKVIDDTAAVVKTREFLCMRENGSSIDVELGVGAFSGEQEDEGEEVFTVVLRDISARKRVERMKDELISTVSHELRTPLTAIIGSIGLLNGGASGPLPPKASKLLSVAERNGQRLLTLIEDILDIQKMEAGKLEFSMQRVDLGEVVARTVESTRPIGEARDVEYATRVADDAPLAWADPGRIEQVVANLLSNATKHAPVGSRIDVVVDAPEPGRLRVQVRDEGPGLSEAVAGRVFDRFEQGEMGDTRPSGGTGLGLAIARAIVQRHGGEIGVESELGKGANFYFELPTATSLGRGESTQARA